jgi:hypothetical protein
MASARQEERRRAYEARRAEHSARVNRVKHHPCPTCETSGHIRRSFGFGVRGDPQSEAFMISPCPTCKGDGALPKGVTPLNLHRDERAAMWWEVESTETMTIEPIGDDEASA